MVGLFNLLILAVLIIVMVGTLLLVGVATGSWLKPLLFFGFILLLLRWSKV